jgi:putative hemolysin
MIRALFVTIALLAVACAAPVATDQAQPESTATFVGIEGRPLIMADGKIDASVQADMTANPAACAKAGGTLRPVCRMQQPMCVITFADAGKTCSDSADCNSGRCRGEKSDYKTGQPATGQCSATNDPCGCYTRIEDGVALPTICVD